jgi:hypothetical protein
MTEALQLRFGRSRRSLSGRQAGRVTGRRSVTPTPTINDERIARAVRTRPVPSLDDIRMALAAMPTTTVLERRDRAVVAFALASGARDNAIASFSLKHIDVAARTVFHDGRDVRTKHAKTFTSTFFPVGHVAHRLRNGMAALQQLQVAALAREAQASWETEAEELRKEVDEIAAYFKRVYSETAGHLVGVLEKMASIDLKVDALNSRAPNGVNWLRRTEATARGIPRVNGKSIFPQIHLPKLLGFDYPENAPLAWPPVAVNHALEYYHAVSAAITHAPPPPTDAERIAASERQMRFVAEQERGRERLNAEAAARSAR